MHQIYLGRNRERLQIVYIVEKQLANKQFGWRWMETYKGIRRCYGIKNESQEKIKKNLQILMDREGSCLTAEIDLKRAWCKKTLVFWGEVILEEEVTGKLGKLKNDRSKSIKWSYCSYE